MPRNVCDDLPDSGTFKPPSLKTSNIDLLRGDCFGPQVTAINHAAAAAAQYAGAIRLTREELESDQK